MSDVIEVTEAWRVVDRWWTDTPENRYYAALRSPSLLIDVRAVVCWDETKQEWSLIPEPARDEGDAS